MSQKNFNKLLLLSLLISLTLSVEILSTSFNLLGSTTEHVNVENNLLTMAAPLISFEPATAEYNLLSMAVPTLLI